MAKKKAPKPKRKPKPKARPVRSLGEALALLAERAKPGEKFEWWGPAAALFASSKPKPPAEALQQSEEPAKRKIRKKLSPKERARDIRMRNFDLDQNRPELAKIKGWIRETGAEWYRHWDGSYQAILEVRDANALTAVQDAADWLPGPAVARYALQIPKDLVDPKRGRSPRPVIEAGEATYVQVWSRLVREFSLAGALGDLFSIAVGIEPRDDYAAIEVQWPTPKKQ